MSPFSLTIVAHHHWPLYMRLDIEHWPLTCMVLACIDAPAYSREVWRDLYEDARNTAILVGLPDVEG